jgi:hypothetical protein
MQQALIPDHLVALVASDDRAQVVVHALARHPLHPLERTRVSLQKRLECQIERENAVCAPEYGNDATSAYTRRSRPPSFGRVGISAQSSCSTCPGR